jgi:hypothetical protein
VVVVSVLPLLAVVVAVVLGCLLAG